MNANAATFRVRIGATKTPATAANAAPTVQLTTAIMSGECPSALAAKAFSATASVACPKRVLLNARWSTAVITTAITINQSRSSEIALSPPNGRRRVAGSGDCTIVNSSAQ